MLESFEERGRLCGYAPTTPAARIANRPEDLCRAGTDLRRAVSDLALLTSLELRDMQFPDPEPGTTCDWGQIRCAAFLA